MSCRSSESDLTIPPAWVEAIAARAAELVAREVERPEPDRWLSAKSAAAYADMPVATIYDLVRRRKLVPAGWNGRSPRFRESQINAYLEAHDGR